MLTLSAFSFRLLISLLLGACIGVERQWRQRMAGLRTNTLVALGAAMFVTMAVKIGGDAAGRVVSYIISGIGFLGAGVIMKDGVNVKGLNTAATLWCSAAVGAMCGMGYLPEAGISTLFILSAHLFLRPVGDKLSSLPVNKTSHTQLCYVFIIRAKQEAENHARVLLMQFMNNDDQLILRSIKSSDDSNMATVVITAEIFTTGNQDAKMERVAGRLTVEHGISEVSWKVAGQENDL